MPPPRRILVLGTSGSGKTTLARMIAQRLSLPHFELDSFRHLPNWVEMPDPQFRTLVDDITQQQAWVIDGNYRIVRDLTVARADVIAWLDLPLAAVMAQVIGRSVHRAFTGQELWNGNRERWRNLFTAGHPIRWAWDTYARRRRDYLQQMDRRWVRLRSHAAARRWVAGFGLMENREFTAEKQRSQRESSEISELKSEISNLKSKTSALQRCCILFFMQAHLHAARFMMSVMRSRSAAPIMRWPLLVTR